MKKRKLLLLVPVAALFLSGCTFKEVKHSIGESWIGQHILHPVYDPIRDWINGMGNKEEQKGGEQEKEAKVTSISIVEYKEQVAQNYVYKTSDVSIRAYFDDGSNKTTEPETVACDTSKAGSATLTVTYKGVSKTATVTVLDESQVVHVTALNWEVAKRTIGIGEEVTIEVTVEPDDATDKSVKFESDNPDVATVSSAGVVLGKAKGSAKITITSNDNADVHKDVTFTVVESAAALPSSTKAGNEKLLDPSTLKNGETINIVGAISEDYYSMPVYSSGNNIKANKISAEDGKLVVPEADKFTVVVHEGNVVSLLQANGKYLSAAGGSSSNYLKTVDTVDDTAKFKLTIDADGYAQLQATEVQRGYICLNPNAQYNSPLFSCYKSPDDYANSRYAIYHDGQGASGDIHVESVSFVKEAYTVEKGKTVDVLATVTPPLATDNVVTYELKSSNPEGCVTLSGNTVTGVEIGSAVILAKSHENPELTDEVTVTVTEAKNYGTLENPLTVSEAYNLIHELCPEAGNRVEEVIYCQGTVSEKGTSSKYGYQNVKVADDDHELLIYTINMTDQQKEDHDVGKVLKFHGYGMNYNGTLEITNSGSNYPAVDEIIEEQVAVTGVSLDYHVLNMEVGSPNQTLVATIEPSNATNKNVNWESSDPEVATVTNGVVHAVGPGDAVITAKSAEDAEINDTCEVHVAAQTKTVTSIDIKTMPKVAYNEDDLLDLTDMVVTIHYSDNSTQDITEGWTTNIPLDHELTPEDTSLVVTYTNADGEFSAEPIALTVTPIELTSLEDVCAAGVAAASTQSGESAESYSYKGVVTGTQGNSFYIQDGAFGMYIYNYAAFKPSVGNLVRITSTVGAFNKSPQSKTVTKAKLLQETVEDFPTPIAVDGLSDIGNVHVLANVASAKFVSRDYAWASNKASIVSFTIGEDTVSVKFDKFGYDADKAAIINGATVGDEFVLGNVFTAVNNDTKQLGFAGNSTITLVVKTIAEIGTVVGPTNATLGEPLNPEDITVPVIYDDGSDGFGKITEITEADTSTSGEHTGKLTIEGWAEEIEFSYTVAEESPYTIKTYELSGSGTQYETEDHVLDEDLGINLHCEECHYTSELRMYSSDTHNGFAIISSTNAVAKIKMNVGNNADTLNVYSSTDGETYTLVQGVATTSAYADTAEIDLPEGTKYIKLDVAGTKQVRIKSVSLYFPK